MNDLKRLAIRNFLEEIKQTITEHGKNYQTWALVKRKENIESMTEVGFNYRNLKDTLLELSVTDYCEGPLQDRDEPGELWVFGKSIGGKEVYIKLKLAKFGNLKKLRIISFHPARKSLCYPYKGEEGNRKGEK